MRRSSKRRSLETHCGPHRGIYPSRTAHVEDAAKLQRLRADQAHVDLGTSTPGQTLFAATWWLHDNAAKKKEPSNAGLFFCSK